MELDELNLAVEYYVVTCYKKEDAGLEDGIERRISKLPDAGYGLFTTKEFAQGSVICYYRGTNLTTAQAVRRQDKSYLMRLGRNIYIDAKDHEDVLARYINDCRCELEFNVRFEKQPELHRALVIATRPIKANEELYVNYGTWYWIAYNQMYPHAKIKKKLSLQ